ncbi:AMP-binding protein [Rubrivivax albus]|uniref:Long-chain acyl-CoA synthetase n=1 Tax=Rubrivivax albus TaxID=2499835 RepID=A0A437JX62_9BURK|nr:AMP-binding protein [Rubrivivax albus]RVT52220.1 long-chain acyl-CoA synthetase [Rubrivivax albus]
MSASTPTLPTLPEGTRMMATMLDNGPGFIALDEAAAAEGIVHVPLPLFFTPAQVAHALQAAGADTLVTADGVQRLPFAPVALPPGTAKITFTSGTTGAPKGVCLTAAAMDAVADGLIAAMAPLGITRHLNALPYAVLLENIAGLLAPRRHGVDVVALPLREVGLIGSSQFDPARLHAAVEAHGAESLILLPQMLRAWVAWLAATGQRAPASLKLVAVGGAAVGAPLIEAAQALGIPACEGYGLSEGASVQTLNLPGAQRPGSAGRALPHARLRVNGDGEIEVAGSLFAGYLGSPEPVPAWWPTGDLGRIDADGYVWIDGRRRNVLITAYGRNVSPEWIETALRSHPAVAQAVVFGDGEPALSAVLWPTNARADLQAAVDAANATLPDYARIARWTRGRAAFDPSTGLATANGRPQRPAIASLHADALAT